MQLNSWGQVHGGPYGAAWCRIEPAPDDDGFCVIVRRGPDNTAELLFSDWWPSFEALHSGLRDYPWEVAWEVDGNAESTQSRPRT